VIAIPRSLARTYRAVLRRCLSPPGTRPEPPLVLARSDGQALALQACGPDVAVRHTAGTAGPAGTLAFRATVLAQVEGKTDEPATLEETAAGRGRASWADGGVPQGVEFDTADPTKFPELPRVPSRLSAVPKSFLPALGEASRVAAKESTRFAVCHVQLRGKAGPVVATDGRQMLLQGGFQLPWDDTVLVPRLPLLDLPGVSLSDPAGLARAGDHLILRVGDWAFWLALDTTGRFPDVEGAIPRERGGSRLLLDPRDAAYLVATLPKLPGRDEDHAPVTIDFARPPAVRARSGQVGPAAEVILARSDAGGAPLRIATNREYLLRAAALGLETIQAYRPDVPLVATAADRTYVWMPLDKSDVIPPGQDVQRLLSAEGVPPPPDDIPTQRRRTLMPPPSGNGHPSDDRAPPERGNGFGELLAEAEALRALLAEAAARSARLVATLRQHRRQAKAVEAAVVSLRQLNLEG
jgi:hypothetical protein